MGQDTEARSLCVMIVAQQFLERGELVVPRQRVYLDPRILSESEASSKLNLLSWAPICPRLKVHQLADGAIQDRVASRRWQGIVQHDKLRASQNTGSDLHYTLLLALGTYLERKVLVSGFGQILR